MVIVGSVEISSMMTLRHYRKDAMESGSILLGIIWLAFVAWLMFSTKEQKETFLFYAWAIMLIVGVGAPLINMIFK